MHYLIALIYFVLALFGLDGAGSHTIVSRSTVNGIDVLYSKARIIADVVDVTCVRSASGSCHYRLLKHDCATPRARAATASTCAPDAVRQFAVATGASRQLAGLPGNFMLCVGQDSKSAGADCEQLPAIDPPAWW
ncbi:hypothetical protein B0E47_14715 [Rhodanobacter sp. B05]|uniref:hypothetical protein n=1 Tax=Rhodanobacter sp. B05 TaxID=1945859 RepID=UPI00098775C3|nr:hypothetical protein [Rhodanobacter sp. B05]OOG52551.1 hypothetical protein B0E47_14715 [Rhodanobacter sp. B05]